MDNSFNSVRQFERAVADFAGAWHGVAVDSCTSAIFLSLKRLQAQAVTVPKHTYVSVPMAVLHAGCELRFTDMEWEGVYWLYPYPIVDSACRFRKGMYEGGLHCLSFQARKKLPIGRGGMILTDSEEDAEWLRRARACGRNVNVPFKDDDIQELGWNMVMTPEQASRGLFLMESMVFDDKDSKFEYPDVSKMRCFQ